MSRFSELLKERLHYKHECSWRGSRYRVRVYIPEEERSVEKIDTIEYCINQIAEGLGARAIIQICNDN